MEIEDFKKIVLPLTIAYGQPAMLRHHFQAYIDNGHCDSHVVWVNGFNEAVWDVVCEFAKKLPLKVVRTSNIGYLQPINVISELASATQPYLFVMPTDFRVTRPTWMQEYCAAFNQTMRRGKVVGLIGVPGVGCYSLNGVLQRGEEVKQYHPLGPHLRIAGLLMCRLAHYEAGGFSVIGGGDYHGADYKETMESELSFTPRVLSAMWGAGVIDDAPIFDYEHWGRNNVPDISTGNIEEIIAYDKLYGVKAQGTTF